VNVADVSPAGIVTADGVVAEAALTARETLNPPIGAMVLRVTVPFEVVEPVTKLGETLTSAKALRATSQTIPPPSSPPNEVVPNRLPEVSMVTPASG
jgi:hypothetical protein